MSNSIGTAVATVVANVVFSFLRLYRGIVAKFEALGGDEASLLSQQTFWKAESERLSEEIKNDKSLSGIIAQFNNSLQATFADVTGTVKGAITTESGSVITTLETDARTGIINTGLGLVSKMLSGSLFGDFLKYTASQGSRKALTLKDSVLKTANGFKQEIALNGEMASGYSTLENVILDHTGILQGFIVGTLEACELADKGNFNLASVTYRQAFLPLGISEIEALTLLHKGERGLASAQAKAQLRAIDQLVKDASAEAQNDQFEKMRLYASLTECNELQANHAKRAALEAKGRDDEAIAIEKEIASAFLKLSSGKLRYDRTIAQALREQAKQASQAEAKALELKAKADAAMIATVEALPETVKANATEAKEQAKNEAKAGKAGKGAKNGK